MKLQELPLHLCHTQGFYFGIVIPKQVFQNGYSGIPIPEQEFRNSYSEKEILGRKPIPTKNQPEPHRTQTQPHTKKKETYLQWRHDDGATGRRQPSQVGGVKVGEFQTEMEVQDLNSLN